MTYEPLILDPPVDIRGIRIFRAENFPDSPQLPWLDRADWRERLDGKVCNGELNAQQAALCTHWAEHGYVIIPKMFGDDLLDRAWASYERALASGAAVPTPDYGAASSNPLPGRTLNPHFKIPEFDLILRAPAAMDLVSMLLGVRALPFQTIAGHKGSQQKAHSDSIHMTTYPQGYLVANWIAFEDIAADSGPLEYYPGSHRLPYSYARECGIALEEGRTGYSAYHAKYETHVQRLIADNQLQPAYFHALRGDVLFWHANLLHGGSPIRRELSSRRALVCHYFADGCICYHDYTGSPSLVTEFPLLSREQFDATDYLRANPDVATAGVDAYEHYVNHGFQEKRRVR
jgi:hypothetical protein